MGLTFAHLRLRTEKKKMQKLLVSFSPTFHSLILHPNLIRTILFSTSASSSSDFLPSYLVAKCGFSPDKAAKAAEYIPSRVRSPDQPDSVIAFFKSHGFNDSHLKRILLKCPQALGLSVEETLAPKFRKFHELGFPGNDLITLVCSNPNILDRNMDNKVVPKIKWWRSLLGSHSLLMKCLTQTPWQIITSSLSTTSQNLSLLQECGLSDHQISTIVGWQPSIITLKLESLNKLVSRVERLGMPRGSPKFYWALYVLSRANEENLQAKVEFFKGFGWSEGDFAKAFRMMPSFFTSSSKTLAEKMEFLVKEAGFTAAYIALHPHFLAFSLEKRLIPRIKVLRTLKEKGLSGGNHKLSNAFHISNKKFFDRYVAPYMEAIPELSQLFEASSQ